MVDIVPDITDSVIALYATLSVASLALAVAFRRAWRTVAREWWVIARAIVVEPHRLIDVIGRCQIEPEAAPRRMAASLFMVASGTGSRSLMTLTVLVAISPWTARASAWGLVLNIVFTLWTIAGYYVALVAWEAVEGAAPSRRFMVMWAVTLAAVAVVTAFAGHQARLLIG